MCGMCGMAGPGVSRDDLIFLQNLAFVTALRGQDSTGVFQGGMHRKGTKIYVNKSAAPYNYFIGWHDTNPKGNRNLLDNVTDNIFAVHCRAATVGENSHDNAHPFSFSNIIGMHNGTLKEKRYTSHNTKTDSELLFQDINEFGPKEVLFNLQKDSAYAIVMANKKDNTIVLARNEQRPLWVATNKSRRVVYWASEWCMLEFAAARSGIKFGNVAPLTTNAIHSFSPSYDVRVEDFPTWTVSYLEDYMREKEDEERPTEEQIPLLEAPKKEANSNVVPFVPTKTEPTRIEKSNGKREKTSGRGSIFMTDCVLCMNELTPLAQHNGVHIGNGKYICAECEALSSQLQKETAKSLLN